MESDIIAHELFIDGVKREIRVWSDAIIITDASIIHRPGLRIEARADFKEDTVSIVIEVEPERVCMAYVHFFTRDLLKSMKAMIVKSIPEEQRWVFNSRI